MSKKHRNHTQKPSNHTPTSQSQPVLSTLDKYIQDIADQRVGGVTNLRGMSYQLLYACYKLLSELNAQAETVIQLEGLEDLDVHSTIKVGQAQYIQLKTSINAMDAGSFWGIGVLQNFYQVHRGAPEATFRLVYNMPVAQGHLKQLVDKCLSDKSFAFWTGKLRSINQSIDDQDVSRFLSRISFEYITEAEIRERCLIGLLSDFDVHANSEEQYLKALFYHAFDWSKKRAVITYDQLGQVIQLVKDSYSKAPVNEAVRHNWLEEVTYSTDSATGEDSYFDGQSAQPRHIAQQLPVRRLSWEARIEAELNSAAVVAIKSSSGQGKSTLAWQVGYNLSQKGRSIYQLRKCSRIEEVNAIFEHLQAWVRVGKLPIVVVDGLTRLVDHWMELAERIADLPIRILVTSREEDWYRYGADQAIVPVQIVDVSLSRNEAEHIYIALRKRDKVNSQITQWQPAWEAVANKGLLIEYVYLLTRGQMLEDRLSQQVKELNREPRDAAAKLEILRLVTAADCLNLQLNTSRLVRHVQETAQFGSDYGEVLSQLAHEYYLRFGEHRVEGLHPVRSQHLVSLLHKVLPLDVTLLKLFKLIAPEETYDFFIGATSMIAQTDRQEFYQQIAEYVADKPFLQMTAVLDGLLCGNALQYWQENRSVFDTVFTTGGLDLFIYNALPFARLDIIEQLSSIAGMQEGIQRLLEHSRKLTPISFDSSDLMTFAKLLHAQLSSKQSFNSYTGVGGLAEWFYRIGIPVPGLVSKGENYLLAEIEVISTSDIEELFSFLWIDNPLFCRSFTEKHKAELLSLLKIKTDTPTLYEDGNELFAEYLLTMAAADKANELSVSRIDTFSTVFPDYKRYNIKGAIFHFLPEHLVRVTLMNSEKRMSNTNVTKPREARLNKIWADTILNNYRNTSVHEWQEKLFTLRKEALKLFKLFVRFLEDRLEGNIKRNDSTIEAIVKQSELVENLRNIRPQRPKDSSKCAAEKPIADWLFSLRNFTGQFSGIIFPKTNNSRNLAAINITETLQRLPGMQTAYHSIVGQYSYFDLSSLEFEEASWLQRLHDSVIFFIQHQDANTAERIYNARNRIQKWVVDNEVSRLSDLYSVFYELETVVDIKFHLPNYIEPDGSLNNIVVGVEGVNFKNEEELDNLLSGLADLGRLDVDFVTLLPVVDNYASIGLRCSKPFFKYLLGQSEYKQSDLPLPLPVIPDSKTVSSLTNIAVKQEKHQEEGSVIAQTMEKLWSLTEYRKRLNYKIVTEHEWLYKLEVEIRNTTTKNLRHSRSHLKSASFKKLNKCANQILDNTEVVTEDQLAMIMKDVLEDGFDN